MYQIYGKMRNHHAAPKYICVKMHAQETMFEMYVPRNKQVVGPCISNTSTSASSESNGTQQVQRPQALTVADAQRLYAQYGGCGVIPPPPATLQKHLPNVEPIREDPLCRDDTYQHPQTQVSVFARQPARLPISHYDPGVTDMKGMQVQLPVMTVTPAKSMLMTVTKHLATVKWTSCLVTLISTAAWVLFAGPAGIAGVIPPLLGLVGSFLVYTPLLLGFTVASFLVPVLRIALVVMGSVSGAGMAVNAVACVLELVVGGFTWKTLLEWNKLSLSEKRVLNPKAKPKGEKSLSCRRRAANDRPVRIANDTTCRRPSIDIPAGRPDKVPRNHDEVRAQRRMMDMQRQLASMMQMEAGGAAPYSTPAFHHHQQHQHQQQQQQQQLSRPTAVVTFQQQQQQLTGNNTPMVAPAGILPIPSKQHPARMGEQNVQQAMMGGRQW